MPAASSIRGAGYRRAPSVALAIGIIRERARLGRTMESA
jgi:hypothetical protein